MSTICSDYANETRVSGSAARFLGESAVKANGLGSPVSAVIAAAKRVLLWPGRVLAARRELEMLTAMSEYELKDIGLTSADVADVTALAADASPTNFLAARIEERHGARQG